jgi:hypothetical protein
VRGAQPAQKPQAQRAVPARRAHFALALGVGRRAEQLEPATNFADVQGRELRLQRHAVAFGFGRRFGRRLQRRGVLAKEEPRVPLSPGHGRVVQPGERFGGCLAGRERHEREPDARGVGRYPEGVPSDRHLHTADTLEPADEKKRLHELVRPVGLDVPHPQHALFRTVARWPHVRRRGGSRYVPGIDGRARLRRRVVSG